jgi:hypothetical protein
MENKYTEFILDEQDKFLRPQKNLMFSAQLLVPSSSKYVIAALINRWFKNWACKMAHVMKILCSGNWLLFTWKTKVSGQFKVQHIQECGDSNISPGTVRTVTWYCTDMYIYGKDKRIENTDQNISCKADFRVDNVKPWVILPDN